MRNRTVVLTVMCMGLMVCGCERKDPSEHSPSIYDERLDPHASVLVLRTEPDLVGDQSQISRRIERDRQANPIVLEIPSLRPEPPASVPPPGEDEMQKTDEQTTGPTTKKVTETIIPEAPGSSEASSESAEASRSEASAGTKLEEK